MKRILWLWWAIFSATGCVDSSPANGPAVTAVAPDPIRPGDALVIEGRGLGRGGHVAIGSRRLVVQSWTATTITAQTPADLAPGQWVLAVVAEGRAVPPIAVEVSGVQTRRGGSADAETSPPAPPRDAAIPVPMPNPDLTAQFDPDVGGEGRIRIRPRPSPPGELVLEVLGPEAWGVAFHMVYDANLLTLVESEPDGAVEAYGAVIGAGRFAYGRLLDGSPATPYVTLRFLLNGPGEGRLEFPPRHRALRDADNRPVPNVPWASGSVRIERTP